MGFTKVYRMLQEIFPQVDIRLLKAVAIEHSKDVDAAVEVVLTEVIPCVYKKVHCFQKDESTAKPEKKSIIIKCQEEAEEINTGHLGTIACADVNTTDHAGGLLPVTSTSLKENAASGSSFADIDDQSKEEVGDSGSEVLMLPAAGSVTSQHSISKGDRDTMPSGRLNTEMPEDAGNNGHEEELNIKISNLLRSFHEYGLRVVPEETSNVISSTECENLDGRLNDCSAESENLDLLEADGARGMLSKENHEEVSHLNDTLLDTGNSAAQLVPSSHQEPISTSSTPGFDEHLPSGSPKDTIGQEIPINKVAETDNGSVFNSVVTRSGHVFSIDILEETINNAKNYKKTLFAAMESFIKMMREVEIQEKVAEEVRNEAARGDIDILDKVEDLRQMVQLAKDANDMHAGEIYGERGILATEVRELHSRLLSLSEERDNSLAILDQMRRTLEVRLADAEEMRKVAEKEKIEKENSARIALIEQEAIMEKVVQESKMLQQEADENSKLREFLIDRGHLVDMLQGEMSVICQDVRLLKEKFDDRAPLGRSLSSNQTSCVLASSSSSSLKSARSVEAADQKGTFGALNCQPQKRNPGDDDGTALSDDGWDVFDKDTEFRG